MDVRQAQASDAPAIARVQLDTWRATYRRLLPEAALARLSHEEQSETWARMIAASDTGSRVAVATTTAGLVAGFAAAGPARDADPRFTGEVYAIYVLPPQQRLGAGRALLHDAALHLERSGRPAFVAWVLARNPACAFFERLGGARLKTRRIKLAGQYHEEVAYAWDRTQGQAGAQDR